MRIIHACGMVEIASDIVMSHGFADNARWALIGGAPILCDSKMVANGITRARLPAGNEIVCTLDDPSVPALAPAHRQHEERRRRWNCGATSSQAPSSPSATRRRRCSVCSRCSTPGAPPPAAVIGLPVGFVGATESKDALAADGRVPFLIVRGRKGGSAMAVAAVNALASEAE